MNNYSYTITHYYPEYKFIKRTHDFSQATSWYSILTWIFGHKNCTRKEWKKAIGLYKRDYTLHESYGHTPWTALKKNGYIEVTGKKLNAPTYSITQKGKDLMKEHFDLIKV